MSSGFETPKITGAQILAVVKDALAVLVAFGVPLTTGQQAALLALAGSSTAFLLIADAAIRRGRAKHADAIALARELYTDGPAALAPSPPPTAPPKVVERPISIPAPPLLEAEAEAEARAHAANESLSGGIDPATLT